MKDMHFSKTYALLLATLPPELRDNAFEYRKLKQLINQTVSELDTLGLSPSVLRALHELRSKQGAYLDTQDDPTSTTIGPESSPYKHAAIGYEIVYRSTIPEPRLRLSLVPSVDAGKDSTPMHSAHRLDVVISDRLFRHIMEALLHSSTKDVASTLDEKMDFEHFSDLIIPLPANTAFFQLLTSTLSSFSGNSVALLEGFNSALANLAKSISLTALPESSSAPHSFSVYSPTCRNAVTLCSRRGSKSDLYAWREIFCIYTEARIFGNVGVTRCEKPIEDMEKQLEWFGRRVQDKKSSLILPESRNALDVFLNLNAFVLNVKKLQCANSEATRKILKKHAKRTTLPIPFHLLERFVSLPSPFAQRSEATPLLQSLPSLLVQAIGEILLPIVPDIDDYSCLICTHIAFKPIRLGCGHFFCVRCLVKLQKHGMSACPLCRAPTILHANTSNIDYGLLNFMADWFPIESREKQRDNEQEVLREQQEQLGAIRDCLIM